MWLHPFCKIELTLHRIISWLLACYNSTYSPNFRQHVPRAVEALKRIWVTRIMIYVGQAMSCGAISKFRLSVYVVGRYPKFDGVPQKKYCVKCFSFIIIMRPNDGLALSESRITFYARPDNWIKPPMRRDRLINGFIMALAIHLQELFSIWSACQHCCV